MKYFIKLILCENDIKLLTLFRKGFFRAAYGWDGGGRKSPLPKICHTYSTMMKLDTVIPYLKKSKKSINHLTQSLCSADISIYSVEICKFCYIKKYRSRLHFDT